jgi:hypothetical protein
MKGKTYSSIQNKKALSTCDQEKDDLPMRKNTFLQISALIGMLFLLALLSACTTDNPDMHTVTKTPPSKPIHPTATPTILVITPTTSPAATSTQIGFAATVGATTNNVDPTLHGDNLTTINDGKTHASATLTATLLNVPARAKGVVYIQNVSTSPQTLVSDTAHGFASFTMAPHTTTTLLFQRIGTFKAHLAMYPVNSDTSLTIMIIMPYTG